jgi:AraC family transcriptional regulator
LAKIALELQHALELKKEQGEAGRTRSRVLARGAGWTAADVVCTSGPQDRPFEERHTHYSVAIVLAGSFQYRSTAGSALMIPGSLLLGNVGQSFECGHEHAEGDRCVSFWYSPAYFERLAADAGHRGDLNFTVPRIPPLRSLAPVVAAAAAGITPSGELSWEELGIELAAAAVGLAAGLSAPSRPSGNAEARVTGLIRSIDRRPHAALTLRTMARDANLSPYHFLRTFQRLTGVAPHQYVVRARLREAAIRLSSEKGKIVDIAFDCGFGDVSNFNRAFRAEFGLSPRGYQRRFR